MAREKSIKLYVAAIHISIVDTEHGDDGLQKIVDDIGTYVDDIAEMVKTHLKQTFPTDRFKVLITT